MRRGYLIHEETVILNKKLMNQLFFLQKVFYESTVFLNANTQFSQSCIALKKHLGN